MQRQTICILNFLEEELTENFVDDRQFFKKYCFSV